MITRWGIYDTQDHCWLGDDAGPKLFVEGVMRGQHLLTAASAEFFARASAQLTGVQMRYAPGRLKARLYDGSGNQLKDEVKTAMTPLEALRRAEDGLL